MWYATETAFIDGKFFDARCVFEEGSIVKGICLAPDDTEPENTCVKLFGDRIEVHTDWFESEDLAKKFVEGKITYIHSYEDWYDNTIHSIRTHFIGRSILSLGSYPEYAHRGIMQHEKAIYKPYWAE